MKFEAIYKMLPLAAVVQKVRPPRCGWCARLCEGRIDQTFRLSGTLHCSWRLSLGPQHRQLTFQEISPYCCEILSDPGRVGRNMADSYLRLSILLRAQALAWFCIPLWASQREWCQARNAKSNLNMPFVRDIDAGIVSCPHGGPGETAQVRDLDSGSDPRHCAGWCFRGCHYMPILFLSLQVVICFRFKSFAQANVSVEDLGRMLPPVLGGAGLFLGWFKHHFATGAPEF